jgi:tetratricopeptide (TPR) repeat protein
MRRILEKCTRVVTAILLITGMFGGFAYAEDKEDELTALFAELQSPDEENWVDAERQILRLWSHSGSDAMDLLLERGRLAIKAEDLPKAIEHLTALTDHAPDFAEGWNARATVFYMMEEYGLAIADIEKTLALNPRHFGALMGLGMIYEILELDEQALQAYRRAGSVHPHRPDILEAVKRVEEKTAGTLL